MRALLVAGADPADLDRAAATALDILVLRLGRKELSNAARAAALSAWRATARRCPLYLEVGPPLWDGLDAALDAAMPLRPDGVFPRDVVGRAEVERLGAKLAVREAEHDIAEGRLLILAGAADSARGVMGLASFAGGHPRLAGLAFDAARLASDLGCASGSPFPAPIVQGAGLTVLAARAAGIPALWVVDPGASVMARRSAIAAARQDGFAGAMTTDPADLSSG